MNKRAEKVELAIEELKDSNLADDGAGVVLETEATVDGDRRALQLLDLDLDLVGPLVHARFLRRPSTGGATFPTATGRPERGRIRPACS